MALRKAISRYNIDQLERKHREGYERFPAGAEELSVWEQEQAWGGE